jgi:hypothetical protein
MEVLYPACFGLDVHKKPITACLRFPEPPGSRGEEIRTFRTTTRELLRLADWLSQAGRSASSSGELPTRFSVPDTGILGVQILLSENLP